jgi:hypothetical protein
VPPSDSDTAVGDRAIEVKVGAGAMLDELLLLPPQDTTIIPAINPASSPTLARSSFRFIDISISP